MLSLSLLLQLSGLWLFLKHFPSFISYLPHEAFPKNFDPSLMPLLSICLCVMVKSGLSSLCKEQNQGQTMTSTSASSPTTLGIILSIQSSKHSCLCFYTDWRNKALLHFFQCFTHRLEQEAICITAPWAVPLQCDLLLLPAASICISLPEGFLPNSRKPLWPQHSRLDSLGN